MEEAKVEKTRNEETRRSCKEKLKRFFTITEEGATPLNWNVLFIVVTALFGSCYSITFLFPFLPDMVLHFGYSEEDKGYYVGYIATGMFVGRMIGSFFWGWLSDIYGRRPIILLTLLVTGITNLAFGFSVNVQMAIGVRIICGLFNGIVGSCKTVLYEISDDTNQAMGMSAIAFAWGSGVVFGPLISGVLAEPSKKYPHAFPPGHLFDTYPFLLPSLVAALVCVISWIGVWWLLPETLVKTPKAEEVSEAVPKDDNNETESKLSLQTPNFVSTFGKSKSVGDLTRTPTISYKVNEESPRRISRSQHHLHRSQILRYADSGTIYQDVYDVYGFGKANQSPSKGSLRVKSKSVHSVTDNVPEEEEVVPFMNGTAKEDLQANQNGISKYRAPSEDVVESVVVEKNGNPVIEIIPKEKEKQCCFTFRNMVFCRLLRSKDVMISVALYTLFSFAVIGWEDVFVVWASTEERLGGLAFSAEKIGTALGASSCVLLCVQVFIYPKLVARFGPLKTLQGYGVFLIFVSTCIAAYRFLLHTPVALWAVLLLSIAGQKMAVTSCFSSISIFLNNSVKPEDAGTVNGIGMTFAALGRAAAPTFCGSVFAWSIKHGVKIGFPFDVNLVFISMGLVYLLINILSAFTPKSLEMQKKPRPKNKPPEEDE